MDRFRSLEVFIEIVDRGALTHAAGALGMSPTMVTTHLAQLEARLGKRLLDRSTRRIALTREGRRFLEDARRVIASLHAAEQAVGGKGNPRGRIRIDAPAYLGRQYLLPAIPAFCAAFPEIAIDLCFGDRGTVFRPDGFDILLRIGDTQPHGCDVKVLGQTRLVHIASPTYLTQRGVPVTPDDIIGHECIFYSTVEHASQQRWQFTKGGVSQSLRPRSMLSFNDGNAISVAAKCGLGIGRLLLMQVTAELAAGELVSVLDEWCAEPLTIYAFSPFDRSQTPAVATTLDFLDQLAWPH